jgi:hypothetical protein
VHGFRALQANRDHARDTPRGIRAGLARSDYGLESSGWHCRITPTTVTAAWRLNDHEHASHPWHAARPIDAVTVAGRNTRTALPAHTLPFNARIPEPEGAKPRPGPRAGAAASAPAGIAEPASFRTYVLRADPGRRCAFDRSRKCPGFAVGQSLIGGLGAG